MSGSGNIPDAAWKKLFVAAQSLSNGFSGSAKQMSEEDRKFLEGAMSELVQKSDPTRQMIQHINELREMKQLSIDDFDKLELIIDELESIVCQIDCAIDFCKLGGIKEIERLMAYNCDPVRREAMRLLPTILQNNPGAQDLVLKTDLMSSLISLVTAEKEASEIKVRALSALSAMVRGYDEAYSVFRSLNGFEVVANAFNAAIEACDEKVFNKAAITLTSIANDLGYQSSLDHGLPSIIIKMYSKLPSNSMAFSYLRDYINENITIEKIDEDNRTLILSALERDLKNECSAAEPDEVAIRDMEAMLRKLKK